MEAKDTIKSDKELEIYCEEHNIVAPFTKNDKKQAQAEISFKAGIDIGYERGWAMKPDPDGMYANGKIDGIREVVEWIEAKMALPETCLDTTYPCLNFTFGEWQAVKKHWGIK